MTLLRDTMGEVRRRLQGIPDAPLEAELLLMTALKVSRADLYAHGVDPLSPAQRGALEALLERRLRREPTAYLMGRREFYGLEFAVAPGVFIPRPETELVVEEALRWTSRQASQQGPTAADVGTGCGAIAVTLAVHLPHIRLFATDISDEALRLADQNRLRHGVAEGVTLLRGDLLEPLPEPVDLIVANLPYVRSDEIPTLEPEVRLHEPLEALDGGRDGLELVMRLLEQAPARLKGGGALILEVDPRQASSVQQRARAVFPWGSVRVVKDLAQRERVVVVEAEQRA